MKILVTGANGQVAQQLKEDHGQNGWSWTWANKNVLDITNKNACDVFFKEKNFDYCLNLAAYTAVDKAESDKELAYAINSQGAANIAHSCHENDVKLIHLSTEYVYNNGLDRPYLESDETQPKGVYAQSKKEGELKILFLNPKAIILRTSWVYSQFGNNFYKTIKRLGEAGKDLNVVDDQIGAPTYAGDICNTIIQIINRNESQPPVKFNGIFNFANANQGSWFDFAVEIFRLNNIDQKITAIPTIDYPTLAPRPLNSVMDLSKIETHFGIKPRNWQEALHFFVQTSI